VKEKKKTPILKAELSGARENSEKKERTMARGERGRISILEKKGRD